MATKFHRSLLATLLLGCSVLGFAQEDGKTILIGRTAGITGPVAEAAKELGNGAQAYFDQINAKGGVNGRKIKMITMDDQFEPALAAANAETLIKKDKVFALFLTRGTPQNEAILPLLVEHKIPLIAPSTGAAIFHQNSASTRYVFNVRAQYQAEVAKGVDYFRENGIKDIALAHVDSAFGRDALEGFKASMSRRDLGATRIVKFENKNPNINALVDSIVELNPRALILVSVGKTTQDIIAALRAKGSQSQILILSNNSRENFAKEMGDVGRGVVISQVTPPPKVHTNALVHEFRKAAKAAGINYSYAAMEGYIAAKVLVEGLRQAGANPTREGLIDALESIKKFDIGGVLISYSPGNHTGSDYVDLTMIGKHGRLID
jgi:branched-chain amino acid transport system substrate-binding protein